MEITVIGAGMVGASAAYHLARAGHQVALVDKRREGEATAAGAGIVCPWLSRVDIPEWAEVARRGAVYYPELLQALADDGFTTTGYERCTAMKLVADSGERRALVEKLGADGPWRSHIGTVTEMTGADTKAAFPPLADGLDAVHVTGAGRVDARTLRDTLCQAAERRGARVRSDMARVEHGTADGIRVVFDTGETMDSDTVVVTSGAWADQVVRPLGIDLPVEPQRGQIMHIGMDGQPTGSWPVVLPETSHYIAPFSDERVVVGATRETGSGFDYRLTVSGVKEVIDHALDVAPGLAGGSIRDLRIGFRPMAPDMLPLLGAVDGHGQVVVATGLGASGITMGPYVGTQAADVATGRATELDLSPYDPLRVR